ncbi:uncharacterized protein LOC122712097 isoform X4 [Apis laboriosa]|uniref:uncharacterized protein LOC122712097 isoform X4 n=1 Tax=Apis laboriosa TaxID=183418 RepID=UPI001CC344DE|nr:uncharacterized protein LOC122712097 isoform X4 [Apis laboriosa]
MKIELSKSGDVSIISTEKDESTNDSKEYKNKHKKTNRMESLIEMNTKLSKCDDASIVQQDATKMQMEHKDKLDIVQESPKKIELSFEEKIKLSKNNDTSIVSPKVLEIKDRMDMPQEVSKSLESSHIEISQETIEKSVETKMQEMLLKFESPFDMKIKDSNFSDASIVSPEKQEQLVENKLLQEIPIKTESLLEMNIKLSKSDNESIVHSEVLDEIIDKIDMSQDDTQLLKPLHIEISQGAMEKSVEETMHEIIPKVESSLDTMFKLSNFDDSSVSSEKQEELEESKILQEILDRTPTILESSVGIKIESVKNDNSSIVHSEVLDEIKNKMDKSEDISNSLKFSHIKVLQEDIEKSKEIKHEILPKIKSPEMKIEVFKFDDTSINSLEKQEKLIQSTILQEVSMRQETSLEMNIELTKNEDESIIHSEILDEIKEKINISQDEKSLEQLDIKIPHDNIEESIETASKLELPFNMKIKDSNFSDASIIPSEEQEMLEESKLLQEIPNKTESLLELENKLSKTDDISLTYPEVQDKIKDTLHMSLNITKPLQQLHVEISHEIIEKSMETMQETLSKLASPLSIKIKDSNFSDISIVSSEEQEKLEENKLLQEIPKETESLIEMEIKLCNNDDTSHIYSKISDKITDTANISQVITKSVEHPNIEIPHEVIKKSMETMQEALPILESFDMKIKDSKFNDTSVVSLKKEEQLEENKLLQKIPQRTESYLEIKNKLSNIESSSIVDSEDLDEIKEKIDIAQDVSKLLEPPEIEISQEAIEKLVETMQQNLPEGESPLDMEMKLSEFDDASVLSSEKQEELVENKSMQEIPKKIKSPLRIESKLPKSDNASIVHSEVLNEFNEKINISKDVTELLEPTRIEILQEDIEKLVESMHERIPKVESMESMESMEIKLNEIDDASFLSSEKQEELEENKLLQEIPKETESSIEIDIKLSKNENIVHSQILDEIKDKIDISQDDTKTIESPHFEISQEIIEESVETLHETLIKVESPLSIKIKAFEFDDASILSSPEKTKQLEGNKLLEEIPKTTISSLEMKIKLSENDDISTVHSKMLEETENKLDMTPNITKSIETSDIDQIINDQAIEKSVETIYETLPKVTSPLGMKIELSNFVDACIVSSELQEEIEENKLQQEIPKRTISMEMKSELSENDNTSIVHSEMIEETKNITDISQDVKELLETSDIEISQNTMEKSEEIRYETFPKLESPLGTEIKLSEFENASIASLEEQEHLEESKLLQEISKDTESIEMKIKYDDASIIVHPLDEIKDKIEIFQDVTKSMNTSHNDIVQEVIEKPIETVIEPLPNLESPFDTKNKISEFDNISNVSSEKEKHLEESKLLQEMSKKIESPLEIKINLSTCENASTIDTQIMQETEDKVDTSQDTNTKPLELLQIKISNEAIEKSVETIYEKLSTTESLDIKNKYIEFDNKSLVSPNKEKQLEEHKFCHEIPIRTESPFEVKIKLSKNDNTSTIHSEVLNETEDKMDMSQDITKLLEPLPNEIAKETIEKSIEITHENFPKIESPLGMKIKLTKFGSASIISSEKQEQLGTNKLLQVITKKTDSPLGMKIKLSKSGDTSIVHPEDKIKEKRDMTQKNITKLLEPLHNEMVEEVIEKSKEMHETLPKIGSPLGMKIKLSKFGDASIISSEKQDQLEEIKVPQEIPKRTESPLGMKIKLSKRGDASIVHSEVLNEIKEKIDISQDVSKSLEPSHFEILHEDIEKLMEPEESLPKVESLLGMKIKLSKLGEASIVSSEKQEQFEEHKHLQDIPKRTESPFGMKIKLSKSGGASIVHSEMPEENKDKKEIFSNVTKSLEPLHIDISQEAIEKTFGTRHESSAKVESPLGMKIKLSKYGDASIVSSEKQEYLGENKLLQEVPKRTESPLGMKIKLSKSGSASIVHSEVLDEVKIKKDILQDVTKSLEPLHIDISHEFVDKAIEIKHDTLPKIGSPLGMKIKLSKFGDASIISSEKQEQLGENRLLQEVPKRTISPLGMKIKLSKRGDASIVHSELLEEIKDKMDTSQYITKSLESPHDVTQEVVEKLIEIHETSSKVESPLGMKIKLSKFSDVSTAEKQEQWEESKLLQEIPKRTESPLVMKIKLSKSGDASIVHSEVLDEIKDKMEISQDAIKSLDSSHIEISQEAIEKSVENMQESLPKIESPLGMKIKFSKFGDASIISSEKQDQLEESKILQEIPKRTESPLGMKIKLSKSGGASIVHSEVLEEIKDKIDISQDVIKSLEPLHIEISQETIEKSMENIHETVSKVESPLGMKIKFSKFGDASIVSSEKQEQLGETKLLQEIPKRTESPLGMKIKLSKSGDASIVHSEVLDDRIDISQDVSKYLESPYITQEIVDKSIDNIHESLSKIESPLGMKIKLSKFGDASIISSEKQDQLEEIKVPQEIPKRTESPLGMKIKLSKTGDASIIQPDISDDVNKSMRTSEAEHSKTGDASLGMKIKLLKTGDASIVDSEKKDKQQRRRDTDSSLEMKIKLSKTGHPTIVACDNQVETAYKSKETDPSQNFTQRYKETGQIGHKDSTLKILKTGHSTILQSNRSELTIEPVQVHGKKIDNVIEMSPKRKDITIAPIDSKKSKLETQFTQILPEVTIQPVTPREQKQFLFDPKSSAISLQQMNVINQEISITQVRPQKSDTSMNEKLKDILSKNVSSSPMNSDCEIIEQRPELIIVNENSNSSQDVVIIEEVSNRMPEVKVPKKRGRPRRNPLPQGITHPPPHLLIPRDPLSLDDSQQMQQSSIHFPESRENERPKRTCRNQKSYAPPRRGRGRGRGKRKLDNADSQIMKKPKIEQDLNAIEASTTAIITIDDSGVQQESFGKSSELYKVLKQPTIDSKMTNSSDSMSMQTEMNKTSEMRLPKPVSNNIKDDIKDKKLIEIVPERIQKAVTKVDSDNRSDKLTENTKLESKDILVPPGHPNWLTPASKRVENATKHENMSTVQVIDEETRMSAELGSRSQTPARNISAPASETMVNEESQGSVLSTATTESEKVKVKNRRMEINFDPDEGPFTVDKIAEYEWPLDRKGETFMIQEQISQYLGVKSFKRKYPDLKRRVVDMEERNYLRENGLVSEAMCDMGLTAVCSSEVLDVMCSDFPDQYEEYRKHMREKQVKEHSKKQKELTAAANAEKNRIDLAEMAVQSALSWNINLNKARRENRKCSLDLQTFTIHVPKKQLKIETERRIGHYPVALIPGQYTDYYREYTPAELRYYPLNTVLYGPMRPNERKFDSQSEGSQSDSDSDSSSDDSSSSSSEGTQDTEGSQSTMDEVDMEIANQKDEIKLKCKMCLKTLNKHSKNEVLIQCGTCNGHVHPSCIDLTLDMVPHIQSYAWQCTDCKTCAQCHDPADEDKMLFCDMCDRGYHIYCVGLRRVPQGRWHCQECAVCANCSSREPGGINSDRNSVAQWQHEYKKGCVETKGMPLDRKNYLCDFCAPNRQHMMKPLVSKTLKT